MKWILITIGSIALVSVATYFSVMNKCDVITRKFLEKHDIGASAIRAKADFDVSSWTFIVHYNVSGNEYSVRELKLEGEEIFSIAAGIGIMDRRYHDIFVMEMDETQLERWQADCRESTRLFSATEIDVDALVENYPKMNYLMKADVYMKYYKWLQDHHLSEKSTSKIETMFTANKISQ